MVKCIDCKHYDLYKRYCNNNDMYISLDTDDDTCVSFELKEIEDEPEGKKYDEGKNRMGLVLQGFSNALWEVGRVGTFGAKKYGEFNWCYLDNAKSRYKDALFRHLFQYMQGKDLDDESGIKHLSHACWNCLALLEFALKGKTDNIEYKAPIDYVNDYIKTEEGARKIMEIAKEREE